MPGTIPPMPSAPCQRPLHLPLCISRAWCWSSAGPVQKVVTLSPPVIPNWMAGVETGWGHPDSHQSDFPAEQTALFGVLP